jgi:hypothetical protein
MLPVYQKSALIKAYALMGLFPAPLLHFYGVALYGVRLQGAIALILFQVLGGYLGRNGFILRYRISRAIPARGLAGLGGPLPKDLALARNLLVF